MAAQSATDAAKICSVAITRFNGDTTKPVILTAYHDLSDISFCVTEFYTFAIRSVASRCPVGVHVLDHEGHHLHVVAQSNGLFGVVLTSASYSKRVAITMIREQLAAFEKEHGTRWKSATEDNSHPLPSLEEALAKYQKPEEVDKLLRVQRSLDDTKEILVQSIETVLAKGERLEKLVEQSEDLSDQSKMFYKSAAATNSCCLIV